MAQVKKSSWGVLARGDRSYPQPTRTLSKKKGEIAWENSQDAITSFPAKWVW